MSFNEAPLPQSFFARPDALHISAKALERGAVFVEEARKASPGKDWVLGFTWADSRRLRRPGTNSWIDLGAGFDIGVYERDQLPEFAIGHLSGVDFVLVVKAQVIAAAKAKLIDVDQTGRTLVLR